MKIFAPIFSMVLAISLLVGGCATTQTQTGTPLLVGVNPNYPPLIYKQGDTFTGVEADLARNLGAALGRPVQFVELPWDDLIPALLDNRIDVIMSGFSITDPRRVRIGFSDPYIQNSLVAVANRRDVPYYTTEDSILQSAKNVGVLKASSADTFVERNMPGANKVPFDKAADISTFFTFNRIQLFIGDVYWAAWMVSENESSLGGIWIPLQEEYLGWGFRKDDTVLIDFANRNLARWKKDGTLKSVLARHVPYLDRIPWEVPDQPGQSSARRPE